MSLLRDIKVYNSDDHVVIEDRRDFIARGNISGARQAQIEGNITGILAGNQDICELGVTTIPTPSLSGVTMEVVSTSANDSLAGTNSQIVTIEYIEPVTEILTSVEVSLNGTTPVTVPVSIAFVSDFYVSQSASLNAVSAGNISIRSVGGATVYNRILAGGNKSLQSFRYIPKGKNFYMTGALVIANTKGVNVRIRANISDNLTRTSGYLFRTLAETVEGAVFIPYDPPMVIPEQTYLKATIFDAASDPAGHVSVMFNGWLEDN